MPDLPCPKVTCRRIQYLGDLVKKHPLSTAPIDWGISIWISTSDLNPNQARYVHDIVVIILSKPQGAVIQHFQYPRGRPDIRVAFDYLVAVDILMVFDCLVAVDMTSSRYSIASW